MKMRHSTARLTTFQTLVFLTAASLQTAWAANLSNSVEVSINDGGTNTLLARLYRPVGFDAAGARFPLVLFLHGSGERGTDNIAQVGSHIGGLIAAVQGTNYPAFLLAPQLPPGSTDWRQTVWRSLTFALVQTVRSNYHVDRARIYLTGLSLGAMGTFDYLARSPDLFAAAVPMSGSGDTSTAASFKDIPIWMFHGELDPTVPVSGSQDMFNALTEAGGSPIYTEIPGAGHVIWGPIYTDLANVLYPWLFSQKKTLPALRLQSEAAQIVVSWPASNPTAILLSASNLTPPVVWTPVTNAAVLIDDQRMVTIPAPGAGRRFFLLQMP